MNYRKLQILVIPWFLLPSLLLCQPIWQPVAGTLTTKWTETVSPANVHNEYPRPQMVRENWKNLNGIWNYSILPIFDAQPEKWDGKILVPFPVESSLSGVSRKVGPDSTLWYKRTFTIPSGWKHQTILLHFEAVDWETRVWVNGKEAGLHQGGYDDFTCDITDALKQAGEQELVVSVWDPSNEGFQPVGKQIIHTRSIWYTSTTGIWQTVWLEPVPKVSIVDFKMIPDVNNQTLHIVVPRKSATKGYKIEAVAYGNGVKVSSNTGSFNDTLHLKLPNVKLWSPSSPFLYDLTINLYYNGKKTDAVRAVEF